MIFFAGLASERFSAISTALNKRSGSKVLAGRALGQHRAYMLDALPAAEPVERLAGALVAHPTRVMYEQEATALEPAARLTFDTCNE